MAVVAVKRCWIVFAFVAAPVVVACTVLVVDALISLFQLVFAFVYFAVPAAVPEPEPAAAVVVVAFVLLVPVSGVVPLLFCAAHSSLLYYLILGCLRKE